MGTWPTMDGSCFIKKQWSLKPSMDLIKILSNGKPNKDGNGTYSLDWGGWSGWYKSKSPTWNNKPER